MFHAHFQHENTNIRVHCGVWVVLNWKGWCIHVYSATCTITNTEKLEGGRLNFKQHRATDDTTMDLSVAGKKKVMQVFIGRGERTQAQPHVFIIGIGVHVQMLCCVLSAVIFFGHRPQTKMTLVTAIHFMPIQNFDCPGRRNLSTNPH